MAVTFLDTAGHPFTSPLLGKTNERLRCFLSLGLIRMSQAWGVWEIQLASHRYTRRASTASCPSSKHY
jgi:hypothetical protein